MIQNRKAAVLAEHNSDVSGAVGKQDVQGHDLLGLLIKSNIAADIPESLRMGDSEIVSRERLFSCLGFVLGSRTREMTCVLEIPTFLLAGHETTRCGP
jgi:hypothetical protein